MTHAAGGGLVDGLLGPTAPAVAPRTRALTTLRALHAERRRLQLRRIEVRVALASLRRTVTVLESAAGRSAQGPAEAVIFEHAVRAAAQLTIEGRVVDQRLFRLPQEIRKAQADALAALSRNQGST